MPPRITIARWRTARSLDGASPRRYQRRLYAARPSDPLLTNFIVAECHALLLTRLGAGIARRWLVGKTWAIERVTEEDETQARSILARYTDRTFSCTDATSFAVMDRLGLKTVFAFDPHFTQYGFQRLGGSV